MQLAFILVVISFQSAFAIPFHSKTKRGTGVDIAINSDSDFCTYLPPHPGQSVSATENDADPFCTVAKQYAECFPNGFIKSAHFYRAETYVQVTGRINHTAYDILTEDGGGQYDNKVSQRLATAKWDIDAFGVLEPSPWHL
ncbi:hypothetical protein MAM1_0004d00451 [Mucor ambiguus]|uniref:Uncharacterized protein n=1 Tax=Mucor ambiguus TaxID=91626 RepID=A0A0C9LZY7_9FUNG|nr:hypothetical protein MAM1_0004d00451 [Mucor ambiguus]